MMRHKLIDYMLELDMRKVELARVLGCNERLVRSWVAGSARPPSDVLAWLAACVRHRRRHPIPAPPVGWRRRVPRVRLSDLKHEGGSGAGLVENPEPGPEWEPPF